MTLASIRRRPAGAWTPWKYNWLANRKLIRALEHARTHARGVLLDVGCGARPFAAIFDGVVDRYLGADLPGSAELDGVPPDVVARAEALPFRDGTIDTVLALSLMPYLPEPSRMLAETARVLRPGGAALIEFPQMEPVFYEHHDYFRYTRNGAAWLLGRAGLEPVAYFPTGGLWARVGSSMIAGLNRINRGPTRVLTELPVRALYVALQGGFAVIDQLLFDPREPMGHLVVARKPRG